MTTWQRLDQWLDQQPEVPSIWLIGEHHGDPQAKAVATHIVTRLLLKRRRPLLVLEALSQQAQPAWDRYYAGGLNEQQLRVHWAFDRCWGFPWPPYRSLLNLCRFADIPVLGLDDWSGPLDQREVQMAARVRAILRQYPGASPVVLIGAEHLKAHRLPRLWRDLPVPVCRVQTTAQSEWRSGSTRLQGVDLNLPVAQIADAVDPESLFDVWLDRVSILAGADTSWRPLVESVHVLASRSITANLGHKLPWNAQHDFQLARDGLVVTKEFVVLSEFNQALLDQAARHWLEKCRIPVRADAGNVVEPLWNRATCRWLHRTAADSLVEAMAVKVADGGGASGQTTACRRTQRR